MAIITPPRELCRQYVKACLWRSTCFVMFLNAIFLLATFAVSSYSQSGESCTTPDNKQGECESIRQCAPLIALLTQTNPVPQDVLDFLRKSHCGFEGKNPLVCCPSQAPVITTQTTVIGRPPVQAPSDVSSHPNLRLLPLNICGPYTDYKVINGKKTELFEYPWMALIGYNRVGSDRRVFRCGGTIINEKYVLTAAHCLISLPSTLILAGVRVGEHDLLTDIDCMEDENGEQACADRPVDLDIETPITHPSYSAQTLQNDIGIVRVRGTISFRSDSVRPICLPLGPDQTRKLEGEKMIVSGWGTTEKGSSSNVLLKVAVPVIPIEMCASVYNSSTYRRPIEITSRQICAGGDNTEDSCDGDSGGPLIFKGEVNSRPRFVQYGIVSFGPRSCGIRGFPAVYTRVSHYVDWILSNMRP